MTDLAHPVVLLDAGDTLLGPRGSFGAVYARVLAGLGVDLPAADWESGLRATWLEVNRTIPAGVDRYGFWAGGEAEYWARFVEGVLERTPGLTRDGALARRALDPLRDAFRDPSVWEVFADVVPVLESLAASGARLAIVSNWDSRLPQLLERLALAPYFDAVVVSHLEGIEKPHPDLFLRAVTRLGGRPRDALHVGDVPELDEAGARAAGIASALVDRRGRLPVGSGAMRDLTPLPGIVLGKR
jgi:putative hydrolase of the HAD superfamily